MTTAISLTALTFFGVLVVSIIWAVEFVRPLTPSDFV